MIIRQIQDKHKERDCYKESVGAENKFSLFQLGLAQSEAINYIVLISIPIIQLPLKTQYEQNWPSKFRKQKLSFKIEHLMCRSRGSLNRSKKTRERERRG